MVHFIMRATDARGGNLSVMWGTEHKMVLLFRTPLLFQNSATFRVGLYWLTFTERNVILKKIVVLILKRLVSV